MKDKIRKFIMNNFLVGKEGLDDSQMLFKEGIIDSFGFVILLVFIEREFNVRFDRSQISMDNFDTVNHITEQIESKLKGC